MSTGITSGGTNYKIDNCYNAGTIAYTNGNMGGAITDETNITYTDCFALDDSITAKDKNVAALSADQLLSGEAAYLLDLSEDGRRMLWTQDTAAGYPVIGTPQYYPVTVTGTNGTVSIGGRTSGIYLGAGNTAQVKAVPDVYTENERYGPQYGYVLTGMTVNGSSCSLDSFEMPAGAAEVVVVFELQQTGYKHRPEKDDEDAETPVVPDEGTGEGTGSGEGGTGTGTGEDAGTGDGGGITENTGIGTTGQPSVQPVQNTAAQAVTDAGETEQTEPAEPVVAEPLETEPEEPEEEQSEAPEVPEQMEDDENLLEEKAEIEESAERNIWPVVLLIVIVAAVALAVLLLLLRKKKKNQTPV